MDHWNDIELCFASLLRELHGHDVPDNAPMWRIAFEAVR
jgi:hypothetical protein